jgi:hypothetical protein
MTFLLTVLERLRLSVKLALGYSAILLVALVLGLYSLHTQSVLNDEVQALYTNELLGVSSIKDARVDLAKMGRALGQAILAREPAERERALRQLAEAEAGIRREIDQARPLIFRDDNKRNLAVFEDGFKAYKSNVDPIPEGPGRGSPVRGDTRVPAGRRRHRPSP